MTLIPKMKSRGIRNDDHSLRAMLVGIICRIIKILPDCSFEIVIGNTLRISVRDNHDFIFDVDAQVRIDLFPLDNHSVADIDEAAARAATLGLNNKIHSELKGSVIDAGPSFLGQ